MKIIYDSGITKIDITKRIDVQELSRQLIILSFTDQEFLIFHGIKGKIFSMFCNLFSIKSMDMIWGSYKLNEIIFYPDTKGSFRIIF